MGWACVILLSLSLSLSLSLFSFALQDTNQDRQQRSEAHTDLLSYEDCTSHVNTHNSSEDRFQPVK